MTPVAMNDKSEHAQLVNPFYSPSTGDDGDKNYPFAQFKVRQLPFSMHSILSGGKPYFPNVSWEPLTEVHVEDRGLFADPSKKNLLGAATKVKHLTPVIGTELEGIDLRQLTPEQKDEL